MKKCYYILTAALALSTIQIYAQPLARDGYSKTQNITIPSKKNKKNTDIPGHMARAPQKELMVKHEDQMEKPFNSNDPEVILSHIDFLYTVAGGPDKNNGYVNYTYDADGNMIYRTSAQINTDDVVNMYGSFPAVIPLNATVYSEKTQREDEYRYEQYYIDAETGQRHDLSAEATVYYGDELVYNIKKSLNEYGQMIEYSKTESEFDAQGRPTVTVNYSPHFTEDDSMYIDLYSKFEYEYLSNNLVSKTISYYIPDENGNSYWQQMYKLITGTDTEGVEFYEKLEFDLTDSIWRGQDKYKTITVLDDKGNAEIAYMDWEWDDETASWIPQQKTLTCQDANGLTTYSEKSMYSTALDAFYIVSQESFDYLDDVIVSKWSIKYDKPETMEQLSDPIQMVSSSYKVDYTYYTKEELGISADEYPYLDAPLKESYIYELKKIENGTPVWANMQKVYHEYALLPTSYSNPEQIFRETCHKEYMWSESANDWVEQNVVKHQYDEYGAPILSQTFINDTLTELISYQYKYISVDDAEEGPQLVRLPLIMERWQMSDGDFIPYESFIYEYNELGQETLIMFCSDWNKESGIWGEREKLEITYDDNHNAVQFLESASANDSAWIEYLKAVTEYYPNGKEKSYGIYINNATEGDPVWEIEIERFITLDEADRIILVESYSEWDAANNQWERINRKEYTYDSDSTQTIITSNWTSDTQTWTFVSKQETAYNKNGERIMLADYNWSDDLGCWLGKKKSEEELDSLGNTIHSAEYEWDDENLRWNGIQRIDRQFDAEGNIISEIIYDSTDVEGNWIGFSKLLDYVENNIYITEQYLWDTDRNSWRGIYRDEYYENEIGYGSTYYVWDPEQWCWTGDEKWDVIYSPDKEENFDAIEYVWDSTAKDWVYSIKWEQEYISTADSVTILITDFNWDPATSEWAYSSKDLTVITYNDKDNMVSVFLSYEEFDSKKNKWTPIYTTTDSYVYTAMTGVRKVGLNSAVSIQDGTIIVDAPGSSITIASISGRTIAIGKDSVSASVRSGIYLVTVDDNTIKVVVL